MVRVPVYRSTGKKTSPQKKTLKRAPLKRTRRMSRSRKTRRRSIWGTLFRVLGAGTLVMIFSMAAVIAYYASFLPPIDKIAIPKRPPNISVLAANGSLLANRGEMGGSAIKIEDLPPYLPNAFIAIEDRRFRKHYGIDPKGIFRAFYRNVTGTGDSMQGGSTITQQLAKNIFLTQERTVSRKIQEAILSVWLERNYTKDEILQFYLNRVYFGAGAYGVEAAARRYFNKSATDVTLAEAAILAGLVQSPSRLAPNRNPVGAQKRAEKVLLALRINKMAPGRMIDHALKNPAKSVSGSDTATANYAADYVMDILEDFIGVVDTDILVFTTIDSAMQKIAENAVRSQLNEKGEQYSVSQGALVSMSPEGAIKALVGGRDYSTSQFNRATVARRQPGSSFKPFVYLTAVDNGVLPDDMREDAPIKIGTWQPENYSRTFFGPVTVRDSLALSLNTVAVRLCMEVSPKSVIGTARRLGIASPMKPNASIALGTSEVTPLEMTGAFTAFANGGRGIVPYVITQVSSAENNKVIYLRDKNPSFGQVVSPQSLSMMNDMLNASFEMGTARKGGIPGWQAAGKTGTSQQWRDAWFVGYTSSLVTGVWVGNDDGKPTKRASGSNIPLDIWNKYMVTALKGYKPSPLPGAPWERNSSLPQFEDVNLSATFESRGNQRHPSAPIPDGKKGFFERVFGF